MIIRSNSSAVDFALLNEGKLIELNKETDNNKFSVGDIFFARVKKPISGLNAADFALVSFPPNVAANDSAALLLNFTPSAAGTRNAVLNITSNLTIFTSRRNSMNFVDVI